tara:strand:- start:564 stop:701 length:138 start_codon:yes stop_codon:yes gene_type:complete
MIHVLEIALVLSLVAGGVGLASLAPRPKPVPIRVRANRDRRHPDA